MVKKRRLTVDTNFNSSRTRAQYLEGREAFREGKDSAECPYLIGRQSNERVSWMLGFFDSRTYANVGHILDKYDLEWP